LTAWFQLNTDDPNAREFLYSETHLHYVFWYAGLSKLLFLNLLMHSGTGLHSKLTTWCRWMKAWKINLESEVKERSLAKELVGPNLESETVLFTFSLDGGAEEVRKAPMAYVPDLVGKVKQLLDENEK
jgi:hypothetical protein